LAVPGESLVLIARFFAHRQVLDLDAVILVVVAGAIVGDNIGYEIGHRLGRGWLLHYDRRFGLRERHIARAVLGYFLGASWRRAEQWVGRGSAIIGAALMLAGLATWL
jgi:membrane protein DedA with SNARE-associated domain